MVGDNLPDHDSIDADELAAPGAAHGPEGCAQ
jgi:hypothetical protein